MRIVILLFVFYSLHRVVSKIKDADLMSYKVVSIFLLYWFIALILATAKINNINEISFGSFAIMLLGVVSFTIGFLLIKKSESQYNPEILEKNFSLQFEKIINNRILVTSVIIASIYVISLLVVFFRQILYYNSLYDVRLDYYSHELYGPSFVPINLFILHPLAIICLPVFAYQIFYKRDWKCIIFGFFLFGYYSLGGGRIDYMRIVFAGVFLLYCLLDIFKRKRNAKSFALGSMLLVLILITVTTSARIGAVGGNMLKDGYESTKEHILCYSACPIVAFDKARCELDYVEKLGGHTMGNLTGTSVISLVNLFSSRLGIIFPTDITPLTELKQNNYIYLGPNNSGWNALYTANLFFYIDFGVFGVFLFPFLFGLLFRVMVNHLCSNNSIFHLIVVSYLFFIVVCSVMDYSFNSPYTLLTLLVFWLIGNRDKVVE